MTRHAALVLSDADNPKPASQRLREPQPLLVASNVRDSSSSATRHPEFGCTASPCHEPLHEGSAETGLQTLRPHDVTHDEANPLPGSPSCLLVHSYSRFLNRYHLRPTARDKYPSPEVVT